MAELSVFDVGAWFIERSGDDSIQTIKLQKLCFFAFGWYAHLTGDHLFPERFYAMEKGPVVGELLSAHAGRYSVDHDQLMTQLAARDGFQDDLPPYKRDVLEAVWDYYGRFDRWQLVELTHRELVWREAWDRRPVGSRRGNLPHHEIVHHFLQRSLRADESVRLPPSTISFLSDQDFKQIEDAGAHSHAPFVDAIRAMS